MAVRKIRNFLPSIFQTDTNEKFLSATMDQLTSEPKLTNLYGYIGRKFAPTFRTGDSYITESSADRQDYQLEPSTVVQDASNNITDNADQIHPADTPKKPTTFFTILIDELIINLL